MSDRKSGADRALIYARVSTRWRQDIGLQLAPLRDAAERSGWTVEGEYTDVGESGILRKRPGLEATMKAARSGACDVVMVWRFDRWARSVPHLLESLCELDKRGVRFFSLCENIDTSTPIGRAMFTVIGAMAELERDLLRERVNAGMDRARSRGVHCGRPRKEVDLTLAARLLEEGMSQRLVARKLNVSRRLLARRLAENLSGAKGSPPKT